MLRLMGVREELELGEDEHDSVFLLVPQATGPPTLLRLHY